MRPKELRALLYSRQFFEGERVCVCEREGSIMSFSFFKPSRPKTPQEVAKAINDSLMALDIQTVAEVKALEKVLFNRLAFAIFVANFMLSYQFTFLMPKLMSLL